MMGKNKQIGFTIVELLSVIVVIGILAAITIVAFNGIQGRANDASVRSDLTNIAKKFEIFYINSESGQYPTTATDLNSLGLRVSKGAYLTDDTMPYNLIPCYRTGAQEYVVAAMTTSAKRLYITKGSGVQEYTGSTSWTGDTPTSNNYGPMCTSVLSGSVVIGSGAGYALGNWRSWTNGG